jgi:hypothetical protein
VDFIRTVARIPEEGRTVGRPAFRQEEHMNGSGRNRVVLCSRPGRGQAVVKAVMNVRIP